MQCAVTSREYVCIVLLSREVIMLSQRSNSRTSKISLGGGMNSQISSQKLVKICNSIDILHHK